VLGGYHRGAKYWANQSIWSRDEFHNTQPPGSISHNKKVMTQDLSWGSRACRHASPRCVPLHHVVRWLIGHTLSLSKGSTRTYQMAKGCKWHEQSTNVAFGASPRSAQTPHKHRRWPRTITNSCQRLQAALSRLGGGNHQEKQESRSKSTTKCQLDAISQCKCTWITQSHFEYAKKQERWVGGELLSSKCSQVCQNVQEQEPWAGQRVFIDIPLRI
jgi:hypothetical protein